MSSSARLRPLIAEAQKAASRQAPQVARRRVWFLATVAAVTIGAVAGVLISHRGDAQAAFRAHVGHQVSSLLAGIPEHGETLGRPSAPVTLVFYGDLECATTRRWVLAYLPGIIRRYVRPGTMRIEFRAFKTDTHIQREFVAQQTAALAAGVQDRLWSFIETFYYEQGPEYTPYVTERYLEGIAGQVPGLNLAQWHRDRRGGRRSELVGEEDQYGRSLGFHDTPSFQLGPAGGPLKDFIGRQIETFGYRRGGSLEPPFSLIDTQDIATALGQLRAAGTADNAQSAPEHG